MIITYRHHTYRIVGVSGQGAADGPYALLLQQTDGPGQLVIGQFGDVRRVA